jgi:hypothetical protein
VSRAERRDDADPETRTGGRTARTLPLRR